MDGKLDALSDALGASLGGKKLFRVCCERAEDREKARVGQLNEPWVARKSAFVASHSLEAAGMKAIQAFNRKEGVNDFEAREVSMHADALGDSDIYIE